MNKIEILKSKTIKNHYCILFFEDEDQTDEDCANSKTEVIEVLRKKLRLNT